ncbi:hypothetical protein ST37_04810 [Vibrio sp. qd031]|uniref:AsmA family protein n=1 Tax=Vibrio sp. qd031 TaxID=1603038 RepID=UPI000A2559C9|nr:AsmA family protein [Vibrio sp. qd031]ORT51674.1 hypothetical protein ST37_04810 [Vibrio sp. qd031]
MKRVWQLLLVIVVIVTLSVALLIATLTSPYATNIVNRYLLPQIEGVRSAEKATFQFPSTMTLQGVQLNDTHQTYIELLEAHVNWQWSSPSQLSIPSLLIAGLNIQHKAVINELSLLHSAQIDIDHIALRNVDLAIDGVIARNLSLQLSQPVFSSDSTYGVAKGQLKVQLEQLYWQNEALDNIYLDMDIFPSESKIYALSFAWNKASFSTQAEQQGDTWRLLNTQIDKLTYDQSTLSSVASSSVNWLQDKVTSIDNLAITNSHFYLEQDRIEDLQLNVAQLTAPFDLWQQNTELSLDADNIVWQGELWLSPIVIASLTQDNVNIEQLSTQLHQGQINLSGQVTPSAINLSNFSVRGLKWHIEQASQLQLLHQLSTQYRDISIEKAKLSNVQVIYLATPNLWQVSGLDVEGDSLTLRSDNEFALWNGRLTASANTLNAFGLYSAQPWLATHNQEGMWVIDDLYIPLENGVIDTKANMDMSVPSRPWDLHVDGFGIPSQTLIEPIIPQLNWLGFGDLTMDLSGLGGDAAMFSHSLTGYSNLDLRELFLVSPAGEFAIDTNLIELRFERGRFSLPKSTLSGEGVAGVIYGEGDLLSPEHSQLMFELTHQHEAQCLQITRDIVNQRSQMQLGCQ